MRLTEEYNMGNEGTIGIIEQKQTSPETVFIELTSACNADCSGCGFRRSEKYPRSQMSRRHLSLLIDALAESKFDYYLQSGEALLHQDFTWFVETSAKKAGAGRIHLTTNGQLARRSDIPWHFLGSISFSIDGRDPHASSARGLRNQEAIVTETVREILNNRDNAGTPEIFVSAVIRPSNQDQLVDYCQYWLNVGVEHIELIHLQGTTIQAAALTQQQYPQVNSVHRHLSEEDWAGIDVARLDAELEQVRMLNEPRISIFPDISKSALSTFYSSSTKFISPARVCSKAWKSLEVTTNGSIHLSGICVDLSLGSLDEEGIMGAWNSAALQEFRDLLSVEKRLPCCARCCGYFGSEIETHPDKFQNP